MPTLDLGPIIQKYEINSLSNIRDKRRNTQTGLLICSIEEKNHNKLNLFCWRWSRTRANLRLSDSPHTLTPIHTTHKHAHKHNHAVFARMLPSPSPPKLMYSRKLAQLQQKASATHAHAIQKNAVCNLQYVAVIYSYSCSCAAQRTTLLQTQQIKYNTINTSLLNSIITQLPRIDLCTCSCSIMNLCLI